MNWFKRLFGPGRKDQGSDLDVNLDVPDCSWMIPPNDMHDPDAWQDYWEKQIKHDEFGFALMGDMFVNDCVPVDFARVFKLNRVLCAGNGISREPLALKHSGLHVTVLDISDMAITILKGMERHYENEDDDGSIQRFFGAGAVHVKDSEEFEKLLESDEVPVLQDMGYRQAGGVIEYVVGDLSDRSVCPGPFDLVIERRTLQLFPDSERREVTKCLIARMSTPGLFVSQMHDNRWRPADPYPSHFAEPWLSAEGVLPLPAGSADKLERARYAALGVTTG